MSIEPFIKCSDIKISLAFYTEILDFEIAQAPDSDPDSFLSKYACLKRQGSLLHLSQHTGDGVFGNQIYIRVEDLEAVYAVLLGNGLEVKSPGGITIEPVVQTWGMMEFSVLDVDRNKITYGQAVT